MSVRADVERAILDEESMLEQVTRLLAGWPEPARAALALALAAPAMPLAETWKAVALRRHLIGPAGVVPAQIAAPPHPSPLARKQAERLRSALTALVRYRAAAYLLQAEP
jgi:hypothetical protein